jgi:hypothetical protein
MDVLEELINRAILEKEVSTEKLTQEQFVEAVKQAVKAGDFVRLVQAGPDLLKHSQSVVYIPWAEKQHLSLQIDRLREAIKAALSADHWGDDHREALEKALT